jgi:hypothetical protein
MAAATTSSTTWVGVVKVSAFTVQRCPLRAMQTNTARAASYAALNAAIPVASGIWPAGQGAGGDCMTDILPTLGRAARDFWARWDQRV